MFSTYKSVLLLCLLATLAQVVTAQTYCLKYNLAKSNGTTAEFTVSLTASGASFKLGTSNLQFKFNNKAVSNPTFVSNTLAATGVYNGITLTQPEPPSFANTNEGVVSINFNFTGATGTGLPIALTPTEIGVLRFDILNGNPSPNFSAYENGAAGTVVYTDNASSPALLSSTGTCEVFNARIPILDIKAKGRNSNTNIDIYDRSSVTIDWTTSYEKPNSYFTVERSINGNPFKAIGSFLFATYTFVDVTPLRGSNKYRVKQIDGSGSEITSKEVDVSLESAPAIEVYPAIVTDANGYVTLDVPRSTALDRLEYRILNVYGKEFLRGKTAERLDINVEKLPNGMYLLKVGEDQVKFLKQ
jgi:hypothetical protein